jgi:hypothetical protein
MAALLRTFFYPGERAAKIEQSFAIQVAAVGSFRRCVGQCHAVVPPGTAGIVGDRSCDRRTRWSCRWFSVFPASAQALGDGNVSTLTSDDVGQLALCANEFGFAVL